MGQPSQFNRPSPLSRPQIVQWEVSEVVSDEETGDTADVAEARKRRSSETDAQDEQFFKKIRKKYDSIWDRKMLGDRKGSGAGAGAGGALSG
jgi:hypothetical protein